jgi:ribose 5-phosphate isomerase A
MEFSEAKRQAANAALSLLPAVGTVGLGSGSTASIFIEGVAKAIGEGKKLRCVPTSGQSRALAQGLGIPLLDDIGPWNIDLCVDGADEVSENLDLIKGGGGCHLREKIVNKSSRFNVIIVDESKLSSRLGSRFVVPVEVAPFGHQATATHLRQFGIVTWRKKNGAPWLTDSGNLLYDINVGPIDSPGQLDSEVHQIPGVVETGLFVGRADLVIIGSVSGVRRRERARSLQPI